eukprot:scaffold111112_cov72-Phaeocystis_antarctica.AAC.3
MSLREAMSGHMSVASVVRPKSIRWMSEAAALARGPGEGEGRGSGLRLRLGVGLVRGSVPSRRLPG